MAILISAPTVGSTITSGSVPSTLYSGRWKFSFTPNYYVGTPPSQFGVLYNFTGSSPGDFYLDHDGFAAATLWIARGGGAYSDVSVLAWNASQTITAEIDIPNLQVVISGAAIGNGTFALPGGAFTYSGNLQCGHYNSGDTFGGTLGNIEDFTTSSANITVAATDAGWIAAATLTETIGVTIGAADAGWTAAATLTETVDATVAATDAGWTAVAYMGGAMDVAVAATDEGWTAAASLAATIDMPVAATDAGWIAAATLTETINATVSAADAGWNAVASFTASSTVLRIEGRNFKDGAGNVWVPRGPELVVDSIDAMSTIDAIAATGANSLRVLLTLDAINNQTPSVYQQVIGRAVSQGLVVWISMFSWNDEADPPRAIAAAFGGGVLQEMSDYLLVWERQWIKDIVALYDGWIVLDAMQEFTTDITPQESPEAIAAWVDEVKSHIQFFRSEGYTQPLDVMTSFQGRDLASIVDNAAEILAVDTVEINGDKQTCFGWQAYWGDAWYRGWQGERLLGPGQSITASEAIEQFVATADYCIMVGIDTTDIPGDESWNDIMPTCHAQNAGWLWWEWSELAPGSGTAHGPIVRTRLPDGFAGAVLANQSSGLIDVSVVATDAGWTAAATMAVVNTLSVAATDAGWTASVAMSPPISMSVAATDAGWTAAATLSASYPVSSNPSGGAFVAPSSATAPRIAAVADTPSNPDGGFFVGITGYNGPNQT